MSAVLQKGVCRFLATLAVGLLLAAWTVPAWASPVFEPDQTGCVTIWTHCGKGAVQGAVFKLYQVAYAAGPVRTDRLMEPFSRSGVQLDTVKTAAGARQAAQILARYTGGVTPAATLTTGADGRATAKGLPAGAYLAVQTGTPANTTTAAPGLIWLPVTSADGSSWVWELTAEPKVSCVAPTATPCPTAAPAAKPCRTVTRTVPQTQDAAPLAQWLGVCLLSAAALVLLAVARFSRKR